MILITLKVLTEVYNFKIAESGLCRYQGRIYRYYTFWDDFKNQSGLPVRIWLSEPGGTMLNPFPLPDTLFEIVLNHDKFYYGPIKSLILN